MISFEAIMTRGMIFYDEEYLPECKEFCRVRDIQYLPHIHSHNLCYYFDQDRENFRKQTIKERQRVEAHEPVFDSNLIHAFKEYEVLFVSRAKRIVGLVHISDYNNTAVYEFLFKKLLLLEKGLVYLITEYSGLRKRDLMKFLERDIDATEGNKQLMQKDFRGKGISLKTILEMVHAFQLVKIREADIHKIIALRNKVAHSDELVMQSAQSPMLFNPGSFSQLIHGANSLEVALRQVGNRLYFMRETLNGDFSSRVVPLEDYLF